MLGSETTGRKVGNQRFGDRLFRKAPFSNSRNYERNQPQIAGEGIDWGGWRCCQTNSNQSQFAAAGVNLCGTKLAPLGKCGGSVELEVVA